MIRKTFWNAQFPALAVAGIGLGAIIILPWDASKRSGAMILEAQWNAGQFDAPLVAATVAAIGVLAANALFIMITRHRHANTLIMLMSGLAVTVSVVLLVLDLPTLDAARDFYAMGFVGTALAGVMAVVCSGWLWFLDQRDAARNFVVNDEDFAHTVFIRDDQNDPASTPARTPEAAPDLFDNAWGVSHSANGNGIASHGVARAAIRRGLALLVDIETGAEYFLYGQETSIGRNKYVNDVVVDDPMVSREHVLIHAIDGEFMLYDRASSVGTFVNGQKLDGPHCLSAGDLIAIGPFTFEFVPNQ